MQKRQLKLMVAVAAGIFVAVIVSVLAAAGTFKSWQLQLSDGLHASRPVRDDIVIVAVDENTIDVEGGLGPVSQWDRKNYALVLENILKYSPRIVAFDFFFKNSGNPDGDAYFANTLTKAPNPVIIYPMSSKELDPKGYFIQKSEDIQTPLPLEIFRSLPNVTVATFFAQLDDDQVMRRMMPFVTDEALGEYFENLAFAVARELIAEEKPATPLVNSESYTLILKERETIQIPLEDGQMIINFSTVPYHRNEDTYQRVPFINVYNESYNGVDPASFFGDKIVLIGPTAFSFQDKRLTPTHSTYLMDGVEIHANALQTILDRAFLRNMTLPEQIILIALLALASAFMFMFTRIRWSLVYLAAVPSAYAFAAQPAFNSGLILDLVHPYITILTVFMAVYMYRYVTEFKEKMAIKDLFGRYVNPAIAEQIAENPEQLKLGGEKRSITVMFTDIEHFTTHSENLKPESVVAFLNEYLEAMSSVILEEGGTVDKYEGDAIVAFFGAPLAQTDHAARAARAALRMRQKLNELLEKWPNDPPLPGGEIKPVIDFRCGLSSGEAIVGNIGSAQKVEYTAIGDIVNLGSRLEGANKKYETRIMMSEETYKKVADAVEARELDIIRVVGKKQPIRVFELLGLKGELTLMECPPETGAAEAARLLQLYNEGIALYHERKFAEGLAKFDEILKAFPDDGPSKLYRQRCDVLKDLPPKPDWDGVWEMGSK